MPAISHPELSVEFKKQRIERFWKEDTLIFIHERVPPIDQPDIEDPQMVAEHAEECCREMLRTEKLFTAQYGFMGSQQTDINEKMRAILVDWLIEVHYKFKLMPETLFLTVNLIDRFLERVDVVRTKLQLVGVTAMLIACKYEEIYAPEVRDFVYITDKAYTREEIL
jgi:hypothetical protein